MVRPKGSTIWSRNACSEPTNPFIYSAVFARFPRKCLGVPLAYNVGRLQRTHNRVCAGGAGQRVCAGGLEVAGGAAAAGFGVFGFGLPRTAFGGGPAGLISATTGLGSMVLEGRGVTSPAV